MKSVKLNNFSDRIGFFLGTILLLSFFIYAIVDEKQGMLYVLSFGATTLLFAFITLFGLKTIEIRDDGVKINYALSFIRKQKVLARTKVEFRLLPRKKIGPKNGVTLRYENKSIINKNLNKTEQQLNEFFQLTSSLGYMWAIHSDKKQDFLTNYEQYKMAKKVYSEN